MLNVTNDNGKIGISSEVFTYLAGESATSCFGVKGMVACPKEGGGQLLRREAMAKGVVTHFDDSGAAVLELHIGVDHGVNMAAVARSIMNEVKYKLERSTGVEIKSVDVYIDTII